VAVLIEFAGNPHAFGDVGEELFLLILQPGEYAKIHDGFAIGCRGLQRQREQE